MGYDVGFAKRCFVGRERLIEDLASRDEEFRDLCSDFCTADQLRQSWADSAGHDSVERHAECLELVNSLRGEIEDAIAKASVIPFHRPRL
jgi:hypothetical protein